MTKYTQYTEGSKAERSTGREWDSTACGARMAVHSGEEQKWVFLRFPILCRQRTHPLLWAVFRGSDSGPDRACREAGLEARDEAGWAERTHRLLNPPCRSHGFNTT